MEALQKSHKTKFYFYRNGHLSEGNLRRPIFRLLKFQISLFLFFLEEKYFSENNHEQKKRKKEKKKEKKMSTKKRGKNWTPVDTKELLQSVSEILPLGANGWSKVEQHFNRKSGTTFRDSESLKRKFVSLKNHVKPTGDPDCPEEVRSAKSIQREIDRAAAVAECLSDEEETSPPTPTSTSEPVIELSAPELPVVDRSAKRINRTGESESDLVELSKRARVSAPTGGGSMSAIARRRASLDSCIGASIDSSGKMVDLIAMMMQRDERRDEERQIREAKEREERNLREDRRDERFLLLLASIFKQKN